MLDRPKALPSDSGHEPNQPGRAQQRSRKQTFIIAMGVLMFLGMAGFWIWAFSPLPKRGHPDNLNLPEYSKPATQICLQAKAQIAALPTDWDIDNPLDLAAQVKAVNLILEPMLDQLRQLATRTDVTTATSQEDQRILTCG